jgi:hypothetical protein
LGVVDDSRRFFVARLISAACVSVALPRFLRSQSAPPPPHTGSGASSPSPPPMQRHRDGVTPPTIDPHTVLKSYEKDIKRDVGRLLELAQDLKKDADKLATIENLNLAMSRKAEEIEKLAHKISNMARG